MQLAEAPTRTATFSLALSNAGVEHGCLYVVPGTAQAKALLGAHRKDSTFNTRRDQQGDERALHLNLEDRFKDQIRHLPVRRGDVTIHDEWIVHGSGSHLDKSQPPRKTIVMAFRDHRMVEYERRIGFSHSYENRAEVLKAIRDGAL